MKTLRRYQTIASLVQGDLRLVGSRATARVVSPYFQRPRLQKIGPTRNTNLFLLNMNFLVDSWGVAGGNPYVVISWWNLLNVFQNSDIVFMTVSDVQANGLAATILAGINGYATTNTLTVNTVKGVPSILVGAPQAAIADAPTDAVTNYNVVTTLLGGLTGAVNTANTKQNDIATKLNSLFAELRTLGLIAP